MVFMVVSLSCVGFVTWNELHPTCHHNKRDAQPGSPGETSNRRLSPDQIVVGEL
jgi:hypothetical protein